MGNVFQKYALHESVVIVLHFMAQVVYGFSPWIDIFVMLENTRKGSLLVSPSFPSSYVFGLKFRQLYLPVGIIERWNKLYNTIVLQDNTFQNIIYRDIIN